MTSFSNAPVLGIEAAVLTRLCVLDLKLAPFPFL